MIIKRILAVIAAILLVGAFAVAMVLQPDLTLGDLLGLIDRTLPHRLQAWEQANLSSWAWTSVTLPLLIRPAWLIPACCGVICAGAAVTIASGGQQPRRRRS